MWQQLSAHDKRRFIDELATLSQICLNPMPPESGKALLELADRGLLEVKAGVCPPLGQATALAGGRTLAARESGLGLGVNVPFGVSDGGGGAEWVDWWTVQMPAETDVD